VSRDSILQIACIITDGELEEVVEGPELTISHSEEVLAGMNAWCIENHERSGLTAAVRASSTSMAEAEAEVLEFIMAHIPEPSTAHIAGGGSGWGAGSTGGWGWRYHTACFAMCYVKPECKNCDNILVLQEKDPAARQLSDNNAAASCALQATQYMLTSPSCVPTCRALRSTCITGVIFVGLHCLGHGRVFMCT
jgi:hypothetical protein